MKNYSKVGGQKGKPAYRTPSSFKYRAAINKRMGPIKQANLKQGLDKSRA